MTNTDLNELDGEYTNFYCILSLNHHVDRWGIFGLVFLYLG